MSAQDQIDLLRAQQGTFRTIDPNFLANRMQGTKDSVIETEVVHESFVDQIPSVTNEPETVQFEVENPYRPGAGLVLVENTDPSTLGEVLPQVYGTIDGFIGLNVNRTGGGQVDHFYVWMEYFFPMALGGPDDWIRYGQVRPLVSRQNEPIEIEKSFRINRCAPTDRFRFRMGVDDAGEGIGAYAIPPEDIAVNVPPPVAGVPLIIPSAELIMLISDYGLSP